MSAAPDSVPLDSVLHGDNLAVLEKLVPDGSVDLVYLDPPFDGRNRFGSALAGGGAPEPLPAEIGELLRALGKAAGSRALTGYLAMMAPRLAELRRVLKPEGSLYLHCDPPVSHYLKVLLDSLFGRRNFRNEIIWAYKSGGASRRRFAGKHDVILYYTKDAARCKFNPLSEKSYNRGLKPYRFKGVAEDRDELGWFTTVNMRDVWALDMVGRTSGERTGYPTQKPEALLERIILASSDPGDLVLDPFCGSGTTPAVAQRLGRRWLGIDNSQAAVDTTRRRLAGAMGQFSSARSAAGNVG